MTWAGTAIGPIVAGELLKATQNLLSVYYFSFGVNIFLFIMWAFVVPESLDKASRAANLKKWEEARRVREHDEDAGPFSRILRLFSPHFMLELIEPLSIFLPRRRDPDDPRQGRDWNLTCTALSYLCLVIVTVRRCGLSC